jgi:hypothetical protein
MKTSLAVMLSLRHLLSDERFQGPAPALEAFILAVPGRGNNVE